ncbi:enoyl-CoA hydratase [Paraburkholderia sp. 22099]|jgi:enoyl-CoA hydratase|uniref:Enoyl-CoA hydratase n=1 Tax=Paraburkholderia terricola TaxID=169427 RepID=A0ABU1LQU9_9BURK|nr:enoyl-CoA hydratase [Paraburkholderia terricola]AXE96618.1 enoyl-CoA hydratase [Paraburkholderia terricola]MDR6409084.1 enoyl-CoA hydratase [Paraburkholderia terricola]MDR6450012.1 enoyl-CoA hydratase [Paraburkholderia terricola]MDR6482016.1 enoyl-CoA hydratase [Paraburkholderia terricola]MDR6496778.1 enoyl-CoA hydratase [Paraburkholderia terricola]
MTILIERRDRVAVIRLNRPKAMNALSSEVMEEIVCAMQTLDRDPQVGCFVLTGSEKVFAAGADIKEMQGKSYMDMFNEDFFAGWDNFAALRTPKIAAVSGFALGGGCELAMMCDMIFAAETAVFGQPEIRLGVIPGMGGSQRLTKLIGKAKAMDMILTGRTMAADEAERAGLVARVIPADRLMEETLAAAATIAGYGKVTAMVAREAVDRALELGLREGLLFERRTFHALFATEDQKEGMRAFVEKKTPEFKGR